MCTLEYHRGKRGLNAGWSFIWFSVLQNIKNNNFTLFWVYEQLRRFWGITLAKKLIFKVTSDVFDAHCSEHLQPLTIWENYKCFPWTTHSMRWLWQKNWALRSEHANIFSLSLYNEFCQIMDKNTSWLLASALWMRCSASLLDNSERYLVSVSADFALLSIWINRGLTEGVFVQEWGR